MKQAKQIHKRFSIFLIAILIATGFVSAFSQPYALAFEGVYQFCSIHCETYKINVDNTFEYIIDGDLYNNERVRGKWSYITPHIIQLKSERSEHRLINKVTETTDERESLKVELIDLAGQPVPGAIIAIVFNEKQIQFVTNEKGWVQIPKVEQIILESSNKKYTPDVGTYNIVDKDTTRLTFVVDIDLMFSAFPIIESDFLLIPNAICRIIEVTGEVNPSTCHSKISSKKAKGLFNTIMLPNN